MTPKKNQRPPARAAATPIPVGYEGGSSEADGVNIVVLTPAPRRWLRVILAFPGADPAQAALGGAWFATRLRVIEPRLRLTLDRRRCAVAAGELVLGFAPQRGGSLAAEWLEEVRPRVEDLVAAEFDGAELKSVEVVSES